MAATRSKDHLAGMCPLAQLHCNCALIAYANISIDPLACPAVVWMFYPLYPLRIFFRATCYRLEKRAAAINKKNDWQQLKKIIKSALVNPIRNDLIGLWCALFWLTESALRTGGQVGVVSC